MIGSITTFFRLSHGLIHKQSSLLQTTLPRQFNFTLAIQRLVVPKPTITTPTQFTARFSTSHKFDAKDVSNLRYFPNAIHNFFSDYPKFQYDHSKHYHAEVQRFFLWIKNKGVPMDIHKQYQEAQFKAVYDFFRSNEIEPDFEYTFNDRTSVDRIFERLRVAKGWPTRKQRKRDPKHKTANDLKKEEAFLNARSEFRKTKKKCAEHVHAFFQASFSDLDLDPSAPYSSEFARLCRARGWVPESSKSLTKRCRKAQVVAFGEIFGKEEQERENWIRLFAAVGVKATDVPQDLVAIKEKMLHIFVNLVDLVDEHRFIPPKSPTRSFTTNALLEAYTKKKGYLFPNPRTVKGGKDQELLVWLLREVYNPYEGWRLPGKVAEGEARIKAQMEARKRKEEEEKKQKNKKNNTKK